MPHKIDLEEIARRNPRVDLQKLDEWKELRRVLVASGVRGRRARNSQESAEVRAKLLDDLENDPRLVRLRQ